MDRTLKTGNGVTDLNSNSDQQIISASDIERYGYCPLSWWIRFSGIRVSNEKLKKGTEDHREIIKKVSKIEEREKYGETSEFNIKVFAIIAIILAVNAVAILFPMTFIRNLLIYIAVIWIVIALIYFIYSLIQVRYSKRKILFKHIQETINPSSQDKTLKTGKAEKSVSKSYLSTSPQTWRRSAIWFLIIGGGLAFNGFAFLQPASTEIMSRIYMISALLWLIGTMVILYYVLRTEEIQKKKLADSTSPGPNKRIFKLAESENLIIGFAVVATLLAINGLTIQHREFISKFSELGLIEMFLAALWMGISFAFLYISFRSRIVTSRIVKDIKQASTESKKYSIVVEKFKSLAIPERVFSVNWPLFLTLVAIILGINSILIRYGAEIMDESSELLSRFLVVIAMLWLFGSFIFLYNVLKNAELADEIRRLHGIYKGKIEYADKLDKKSKMLFSKKHRIRGKPDYIVKIKDKYIPVEIKTGKVPKGPHFSHIVQIAAYCLLISEKYNKRPPYGIISYSKESKHKINYDEKLEKILLEQLEGMRECIKQGSAHRNHKRPGKCRSCSRRAECPEKLE